MTAGRALFRKYYPPDWWGARNAAGLVRPSVIRSFAAEIATKFKPHKIVLFGSYAYGKPNIHSDVDILVVMPARNHAYQASRIRIATDSPFPLDLIVRGPRKLAGRLKEGDWFLREVISRGMAHRNKSATFDLDTQLTNVVLLSSCAKDGTRPSKFVLEQYKLSSGAWLSAKWRTRWVLIARPCFVGSEVIIQMARMDLSGGPVVDDHDCCRTSAKRICVRS